MDLESTARIVCMYLGFVASGIIVVAIVMLFGSDEQLILRDGWYLLLSGVALAFAVRQLMGLRHIGFVAMRVSVLFLVLFLFSRSRIDLRDLRLLDIKVEIALLIASAILYIGIELFLRSEVRAARESKQVK